MRATLFLFALLLSQVFCADSTYYVSPNGDDTNNGSEDSPFQTIAKAYNATEDPSESVKIYFYPGTYGGVENTAFNFTGPLTINWVQNSSLAEGESDLVQFDCTAAASLPCFFSNTSITINGLDSDSGNMKVTFTDCSTCITVDNTLNSDDINDDYVISVNGVSFNEVSQSAILGFYLHTVDITDSYFSDGQAGGLTLIGLHNVDDQITIQSTNFTSLNKNVLTITNNTKTLVENCIFTNSFVSITGQDRKDSQAVLGPNTFVANQGATPYIIDLQTGVYTVKDSKVSAQQTGGINVFDSETTSIINSTFETGLAQNGGAGYFENVTALTISENCQFNSNSATFYGGAIYLVNSTVHLDATNFTDNSAVDGSAIGCTGNETIVYYDNTTVNFYASAGPGPNSTFIQNTCQQVIQTLQSSLVVSSLDTGGSDAWIWVLVSIAILVVILIIVAAVGFVIYQRKRQSYTRMD